MERFKILYPKFCIQGIAPITGDRVSPVEDEWVGHPNLTFENNRFHCFEKNSSIIVSL